MSAQPSRAVAPNDRQADIHAKLDAIDRRLRWLTTAVFVVALALLFTVAAIFSVEIDFHYGESLLIASACVGGTAMGFVFGWLAHRAL
jgi:uncharacterized membrane-anchored protein